MEFDSALQYKIVNHHSGLNIAAYLFNNQQWTIAQFPDVNGPVTTFRLIKLGDNSYEIMCEDVNNVAFCVAGKGNAMPALLEKWGYKSNPNQRWTMEQFKNTNLCVIKDSNDGLALTVPRASSITGELITTEEVNPTEIRECQKWEIKPV